MTLPSSKNARTLPIYGMEESPQLRTILWTSVRVNVRFRSGKRMSNDIAREFVMITEKEKDDGD